jgi:HPt (histidine-containing phosphotransfer) domain-containing protein
MTEFDEKMQQLRAEYRRTVTADISGLRQLATSLRGDEQDRAVLASMVEVLHRIAGGAGVFGLAQLSEQSHGLELDLDEWLAAPLAQDYKAALPELRAGLSGLNVDC